MMRFAGIVLLILLCAVWTTVGTAFWLVVGPWKLTTHLLKRVNP
jgi:hypothetical protein